MTRRYLTSRYTLADVVQIIVWFPRALAHTAAGAVRWRITDGSRHRG